MARPKARLLLSALALPLAACGGDAENPFAGTAPLGRLRPTAAIVFTSDAYAARPSGLRDVFALDEDGSGVSRLTLCNGDGRRCDSPEVAPAFDGRRLAIRRITADTDGNGRIAPGDAEALMIADMQRGTEGRLQLRARSVAATGFLTTDRMTGLDWSPFEDILVYSANGEGGPDDLYRTVPRPDPDSAETRNVTFTVAVRERRPRFDPTGTVAVFERTDATGKSEVWIFNSAGSQVRVSSGGPGDEPLQGTPFVVGSDTDPDYAPDGRSLVFRRLTATGNGGLGTWDVLTVRTDRTNLTALASGPAYRSAPDWGPKGILFSEIDRATGLAQLVVVQPDGTGRRVLATFNGFDLASPRWLPSR